MSRKKSGNRYLAGLVIAGALVHLGTIAFAALKGWHSDDHAHVIAASLIVGLAPAAIAIFLGQRAWTAPDNGSAGYSASGLVVLVIGAIMARFVLLK